ncbi:MAG: spheroidene monooxygenase [Hyphomicrobiaceae bacterium]|nr:spheroidene monooxygenase [Hyphomicrobiaceae bacterium]
MTEASDAVTPDPAAAGAGDSRADLASDHPRAQSRPADHAAASARALPILTLSAYRFGTASARLWAFGQMPLARHPLSRTPGIGFFKLFGSGSGEGFDPRPNWSVYAILVTWPDIATARSGIAASPVHARWRDWSAESVTLYAETAAVSGLWDGRAPFVVPPVASAQNARADAPLVVLTRATIRSSRLLDFWSAVPTLGAPAGLRLKLGLGEVPLLHQVTLTVWSDAEAMRAFAYRSPGHREAIRRARQDGWFAEDLFARFRLIASEGTWGGRAVA